MVDLPGVDGMSAPDLGPGADIPLLEVEGIAKSFLGTLALKAVDFDLRAQEIHALLGENGAGKSTLIKILAGVHTADGGRVLWRGEPVGLPHHKPPIAFIHQDLGLIETMTVAENIALTCGYPRRVGAIRWGRLREQSAEWLARVSLEISPDALVATLRAAERAMVAIARALAANAEAIVLDEPTSRLSRPEAEHLFGALRGLRQRGVPSIYVTHRLDEVFEIADRVTVLRDGRKVASLPVVETNPDDLIEKIIGRSLGELYSRPDRGKAASLLRLEEVQSGRIGPIDLEVAEGEIVGLIGLRGAGQEEIARTVYGDRPPDRGKVSVAGHDTARFKPWHMRRIGVGFVSSHRAEEMLFGELTVRENVLTHGGGNASRLALPRPIHPRLERCKVMSALERFDVRPRDTERIVSTLSGGNQQKVCLARWLGGDSGPLRLVVLEEPTAGVDIGAKAAIYGILAGAAEGGTALLISSSDFDEIAGICHRAYVIRDGRVVGQAGEEGLSSDRLLALATGINALAEENT